MNCSKCQSLKISTTICDSEEITRCWGCEFVVTKQVDSPDHSEVKVELKLDGAKKVKLRCLDTNPPNAIDHWLWSHGFQAMSGADAVDAMQAEK